MNGKLCRIVGAGDFEPKLLDTSVQAYYIAADSGLLRLESIGITPDAIVGDFDSLGYVPQGNNVIQYPCEKDDTDMGIALNLGIEKNFTVFELYGAAGGRLDHTIANLQHLVSLSKKNLHGYIIDEHFTAFCVTDGELCFSGTPGDTVSIFALNGKTSGVTLTGFKYPLNNAVLHGDFPLGTSNMLTAANATVRVNSGTLTIIAQTDYKTITQELQSV